MPDRNRVFYEKAVVGQARRFCASQSGVRKRMNRICVCGSLTLRDASSALALPNGS